LIICGRSSTSLSTFDIRDLRAPHEIEIIVLIHRGLTAGRCGWRGRSLAHDAARSVPHEIAVTVLGACHLFLLVLVHRRRYIFFENVVHDVVRCFVYFLFFVLSSYLIVLALSNPRSAISSDGSSGVFLMCQAFGRLCCISRRYNFARWSVF